MVPRDGQHFLLHSGIPGPAKLRGCPCHREVRVEVPEGSCPL